MSLRDRLAATGKRFHCVCFTIRSGSTLLRDDLAQLHLGAAHEYFQPPSYHHTGEPAADYVMRTVLGSPEEHFGFKISWHDACLLTDVLRAQGDTSVSRDLRTVFPGLAHLHIVRKDKLGQAVSAWRAAMSGTWHWSSGTKVDSGRPEYDFAAILGELQLMLTEDMLWARHFSTRRIPHLRIEYERYIVDRAGTMKALAAFIGARPPRVKLKDRTRVMRDEWSEEIIERFWADLQSPGIPLRIR